VCDKFETVLREALDLVSSFYVSVFRCLLTIADILMSSSLRSFSCTVAESCITLLISTLIEVSRSLSVCMLIAYLFLNLLINISASCSLEVRFFYWSLVEVCGLTYCLGYIGSYYLFLK
jgi:hypothetical protein